MKVNTFGKFGISVGVAALLVGTLAAPATADPAVDTYGELVGLGSDTTQDVMNGIALAIGDGKIASYDAIGDPTVVTRSGGPAITRASGSGAGRDLLRVAIGQIGSANVATFSGGTVSVNTSAPVGNIDFARSSSGPPTDSNARVDGVLAYVPFAVDAVTIAVDPSSPLAVVPWILGDSSTAGSATPSLYNAYRGNIRFAYVSGSLGSYTYVGVGADEVSAPVGSTAYAIQALLPKSGSGTRSYFIGKVGLSEANITSINGTTPNTIKSVYGVSNTPVEEHDGSAVEGDLTAIVPFSIAQWVAQANEVSPDRRHGAELLPMNTVAPLTGAGTVESPYATNSAYSALTRLVYNIVPSRELDDPSSAIHAAFAGPSSLVCQQSATISEYGFAPITSGTYLCGSTNTALRAYAGSSSSVSAAVDDSTVEVGDTVTVTATLGSSQWTQGGTVVIVDGDDAELGTGVVAVGETTVSVPVVLDAIGTTQVHAEFIPTLAGIAGSVSADVPVSVAGRATVTQLSAPTSLAVGTTKTLIAWVDEADPAGGTVTFKDGATVLGTVTLAAGEQAAPFTLTVKKLSYDLSASYAPPASSIYVGSDSATKSITAGKGTPTISVPTVKTVSASSYPYVYVTVVGVTGAVPTGTVTVMEGTKTLVTAKTLSSTGKYTLKLPKLKKGTHKITIIYSGDSLWNTATKSNISVKIS